MAKTIVPFGPQHPVLPEPIHLSLTVEEANELGAAGPCLRGSGIAQDLRQLKYSAFDRLDFEPVVETGGDCYSRGAA